MNVNELSPALISLLAKTIILSKGGTLRFPRNDAPTLFVNDDDFSSVEVSISAAVFVGSVCPVAPESCAYAKASAGPMVSARITASIVATSCPAFAFMFYSASMSKNFFSLQASPEYR